MALAFDPKAETLFEFADKLCDADEGMKKKFEIFDSNVRLRQYGYHFKEFARFFNFGHHTVHKDG